MTVKKVLDKSQYASKQQCVSDKRIPPKLTRHQTLLCGSTADPGKSGHVQPPLLLLLRPLSLRQQKPTDARASSCTA
jgi:hypothetical protein